MTIGSRLRLKPIIIGAKGHVEECGKCCVTQHGQTIVPTSLILLNLFWTGTSCLRCYSTAISSRPAHVCGCQVAQPVQTRNGSECAPQMNFLLNKTSPEIIARAGLANFPDDDAVIWRPSRCCLKVSLCYHNDIKPHMVWSKMRKYSTSSSTPQGWSR